MLEIIGLIALCANNARLVKNKGRRPGLFVALTIILWIVFEIIGVVIGNEIDDEGIFPYLFGIVFAGIGAMISLLLAKTAIRNKKVPETFEVVGPDDISKKGVTENMALVNIVCDDADFSSYVHGVELNLRTLKSIGKHQSAFARVTAGKIRLACPVKA